MRLSGMALWLFCVTAGNFCGVVKPERRAKGGRMARPMSLHCTVIKAEWQARSALMAKRSGLDFLFKEPYFIAIHCLTMICRDYC